MLAIQSPAATGFTLAYTSEERALPWCPAADGPLLITGSDLTPWRRVASNLADAWIARWGLVLRAHSGKLDRDAAVVLRAHELASERMNQLVNPPARASESDLEPILLVIDDLPGLSAHDPQILSAVYDLARCARCVEVYVLLRITHAEVLTDLSALARLFPSHLDLEPVGEQGSALFGLPEQAPRFQDGVLVTTPELGPTRAVGALPAL